MKKVVAIITVLASVIAIYTFFSGNSTFRKFIEETFGIGKSSNTEYTDTLNTQNKKNGTSKLKNIDIEEIDETKTKMVVEVNHTRGVLEIVGRATGRKPQPGNKTFIKVEVLNLNTGYSTEKSDSDESTMVSVNKIFLTKPGKYKITATQTSHKQEPDTTKIYVSRKE